MKKLLTVLLTLLCLTAFAGCSAKNETVPNPTPEATADPEPTPSSEPQEESFVFNRGIWNEDRTAFANVSTNIVFTLKEPYTAVSDEDLAAQILGEGVDLASWGEEEFASEITIPDAQIMNSATAANMIIAYENIAAEGAASISEKTYMQVLQNNYLSSEDTTIGEAYTLTLNGADWLTFDLSTSNGDGAPNIDQTFAVRKVGPYMAFIVFTQVDGRDEIEEMISFFN